LTDGFRITRAGIWAGAIARVAEFEACVEAEWCQGKVRGRNWRERSGVIDGRRHGGGPVERPSKEVLEDHSFEGGVWFVGEVEMVVVLIMMVVLMLVLVAVVFMVLVLKRSHERDILPDIFHGSPRRLWEDHGATGGERRPRRGGRGAKLVISGVWVCCVAVLLWRPHFSTYRGVG
jgi:hypothetical protein